MSALSTLFGSTSTTDASSTSTPTWTPAMQSLQDQLSSYSSNLMQDPSAGLQPMKLAAQDNVNRRYMQAPDQISRTLAARGYGSSGKFGNSMYQSAYARSGELSNLDSQFAALTAQQKNTGASLSDQLLALTRGTSSSQHQTTQTVDIMHSLGALMSGIGSFATGGFGGGGGGGIDMSMPMGAPAGLPSGTTWG